MARPVTVKVLHRQLAQDPGFRDRFRQESVAAARLAHPNVVATYDTGEEAGTAFVVTELVRGESLADALATHGFKRPPEAAGIADQVAAALEHGHRAGLVHGAVSPRSIFLCDDGLGGTRVKLADFGIAPADSGGGGAADDVRGLGAVLYEMLTGQPPARESNGDIARPRRLRAGIPKPLDALTMRAVATDPRERFRSAFDFRRSLAALDLGPDDAEPLHVASPTPPHGVAPTPRRARRTWVPLAIFVILAGAAAAAVVAVMNSGSRGPSTPVAGAGATVAIAEVHSFDPEANPPTENEERAKNLVDNNLQTTWSTDRYFGRHFGGLKNGVGIVVRLTKEQRLNGLTVDSRSSGWSAEVFVADAPKKRLADWGKPVAAEAMGLGARAIFNLQSTKGGAVLLWITDPGPTNQLELSEISVRA